MGEGWEWGDERGREGKLSFENARSNFRCVGIGVLNHFEFGIEVVDVVEGVGFGGAR